MCFAVEELDTHAAWIRPVLRVGFVRLDGELKVGGCGGEDVAGCHEDVPGQRVRDCEGLCDSPAFGAGACRIEIDGVEGAVCFDILSTLLGGVRRRRWAEECGVHWLSRSILGAGRRGICGLYGIL